MRCADCGKPVTPAKNVTCPECDGVPIYYHDSAADSAFCLGAGPHVQGVSA